MPYAGNVLRVNLNDGTCTSERPSEEWLLRYWGGKGLGFAYLYAELEADADPFAPSNLLVLATGPATGTLVPCSGKLTVVTKSPLTGLTLDCSIGGRAATSIKFAGYDALVIIGKAPRTSVLIVDGERVEIRDASWLKGLGTFETEERLRDLLGEEWSVLAVGPAGENLVPIACICTERYRQAARGGVGAVMGGKNLKAICVKGSGGLPVADLEGKLNRLWTLAREDALGPANIGMYLVGTPMTVAASNAAGLMPTRNFQEGIFEAAGEINDESVLRIRKAKNACTGCPIGCGNYVEVGGLGLEGPEYETLAMCGSNCGISDMQAIVRFNYLCDDLGIDTISAGAITSWAMEMTERGLHDFRVRFGDVDSYLAMPETLALRKGDGDILCQGVRYTSEIFGGDAFAMHVKGLELPAYDPRGSWGMGLAYVTADRGGCHMRAWPVGDEAFGSLDPFSTEGKAELVVRQQDVAAAKHALGLCDFWVTSEETLSEVASIVLGRPITTEDLRQCGKRIWNLSRAFNCREGYSRLHDVLPPRLHDEPLPAGRPAGRMLPREALERMLDEYYALRGWSPEGVPYGMEDLP